MSESSAAAPEPAFSSVKRPLRRRSLVLLVALLPTLTFFGHWPAIQFTVPGTDLQIGLPGEGHDDGAGESSSGHDHTRHCHADLTSCSDVPFTGASAFALLIDTVAFLSAAALWTLTSCRWWLPTVQATVRPELAPPRVPFALSA